MTCPNRNEYARALFCTRDHKNVTWDECVKCQRKEDLLEIKKSPFVTYVVPCCACINHTGELGSIKCQGKHLNGQSISVRDIDYCSYGRLEERNFHEETRETDI
jgi:hypothetical protein